MYNVEYSCRVASLAAESSSTGVGRVGIQVDIVVVVVVVVVIVVIIVVVVVVIIDHIDDRLKGGGNNNCTMNNLCDHLSVCTNYVNSS
jgi:hypothetical protein